MKRNTRYILITLAAAVVLGGAITALLLTQPAASAEEDSSSSMASSSTEEISLYSHEGEDVASIDVTNAEGGYRILTNVEIIENSSSSSDSESDSSSSEPQTFVTYYLDGIDQDLQNTSSVSTAAGYCTSLSATREIGAAEDLNLEEYGLDDPQLSVTTTLSDGEESSYSVGDEGPVSGYYVLYDDKVYVSESVGDSLFNNRLDFVNTTILSITPPEDTDDSSSSDSSSANEEATNEFTKFTFTGTNFPQEVQIVPQTESLNSDYKLSVPYEVDADQESMTSITSGVASLTATSVAAVEPTEEQLAEFGLAEPTVRLDFAVNGNSYTLLSGGTSEDGGRYVMLDGVDVVYICDDSTVGVWANATLFSLRDSFVLMQNIANINRLTVETPNGTDVFNLTRTENEESSTEDNIVYDYSVKGTDGQDITYKGVFTAYYQTIIGIQLLDETTETEPSGEPMLTVTYDYYDGRDPHTVSYYDIGDRRCLVEVDGTVVGVVSQSVVQSVIDNTEVVLQNKSVNGDEEE